MKVLLRKAGRHTGIDRVPQPWPFTEPPRLGDTVTYDDGETFIVSQVIWYPDEPTGPYVYVILRDDV